MEINAEREEERGRRGRGGREGKGREGEEGREGRREMDSWEGRVEKMVMIRLYQPFTKPLWEHFHSVCTNMCYALTSLVH